MNENNGATGDGFAVDPGQVLVKLIETAQAIGDTETLAKVQAAKWEVAAITERAKSKDLEAKLLGGAAHDPAGREQGE